MTTFLLMAMLWSTPTPIRSQEQFDESFRAFISNCERPKADFLSGVCMGQLRTMLILFKVTALGDRVHVCMPLQVTVGDFEKVVLKYAADHPEELHEGDILEILKAAEKAFPCEAKRE